MAKYLGPDQSAWRQKATSLVQFIFHLPQQMITTLQSLDMLFLCGGWGEGGADGCVCAGVGEGV